MSDNWLQLAREALKVPSVLVEIYGDLARPGVRQAGKALETIVGLGNTVLWPIALANERSRLALERNLERYRKALEDIPIEKIVSVAPEIGVPVAEKLAYVADESLVDLYVRLLASASNSDTVGDAHPSFVNVITNLSPDEARFLEHFKTATDLPITIAKAVESGGIAHTKIGGPFIEPKYLLGISFPQNVDAYLSNLEGLGLIAVKYDAWLTEPSGYEAMEKIYRPKFEMVIKQNARLKDRELGFGRGVVQRTSFGWKFIRACHAR